MALSRRVFVALAVALLACGAGDGGVAPRVLERREWVQPGAPHEARISDPALALASDATPWLAWVRDDVSGRHILAARFAEGEPQPLRVDPDAQPPASGHQPPGLAVGPDGRAHVSWSTPRGEDTPFASDLVLATSREGGGFGSPLRLHDDLPGSRSFESLAVDAGGAVLAAWIEGGATAGTRVVRVANGAAGPVAQLGARTCPCCRVAVAADLAGRVGLLWRDELPGRVRDMVFTSSEDGAGFAPPRLVHDDGWSLDACPHRGGALSFDPQGRAWVAWYTEGRAGRPALLFAVGGAEGFGAPRALHEDAASLPDRVALAVGRDGTGIALWERATSVRREIAARAVYEGGSRLGPVRVLSRGVHASGPALAASPQGGFVAAWNEEEFPLLRTVVARIDVESP